MGDVPFKPMGSTSRCRSNLAPGFCLPAALAHIHHDFSGSGGGVTHHKPGLDVHQTIGTPPGITLRSKPTFLHLLSSAASSKNSSDHLCFPQPLCLLSTRSISNWASYYFHSTAGLCGAGFDAVHPSSFLLKGSQPFLFSPGSS